MGGGGVKEEKKVFPRFFIQIYQHLPESLPIQLYLFPLVMKFSSLFILKIKPSFSPPPFHAMCIYTTVVIYGTHVGGSGPPTERT